MTKLWRTLLSAFAKNDQKHAVEYWSFKGIENNFSILQQIKAIWFKCTIKHHCQSSVKWFIYDDLAKQIFNQPSTWKLHNFWTK